MVKLNAFSFELTFNCLLGDTDGSQSDPNKNKGN